MSFQPGTGKIDTPSTAGDGALNQALFQLALRIEAVLEEERQLLSGAPSDALDQVITRKNHLAQEVMRVAQRIPAIQPDARLRNRFRETVGMLNANEVLLRRHIAAVGEISAVVAEVIRNSTSDGTYSSDAVRRGQKL